MEPDNPTYLHPSLERLLLVVAFSLISFIGFESLAVATAMPTVVEALDGMPMYALAMGLPLATQLITVALAGPWSDSLGPRSCLFAGIVLFALGLLIAAAAMTMPVFVIGRAVQGLGGGMTLVPLYTIIGSSVRPSHQPKFFAAFAAAWVMPALIGPAISGFVVVHWSWRWIFGVVPAIMILAAPLVFRITASVAAKPKPLDRAGLVRNFVPAAIAGIGVAVLQVTSGQDASTFTPVTYAVLALAAIASFAAIRPLFPAGTFTSRRGLGSTVLLRGALNATYLATEAYLPLMLKEIHGWSPFHAGLALTMGSLTWALGSWLQGRIASRTIRDRLPLIGALIQLVGLALTIPPAFPSIPGAFVLVGWLIAGLGCGMAYPGMSVHALALTPLADKGKTSSALQLADTFGSAISIAITGVVFALLQPAASVPFVGAISLMVAMQIGAVFTSTRLQPPPGSAEAHQLHMTYSLDEESA